MAALVSHVSRNLEEFFFSLGPEPYQGEVVRADFWEVRSSHCFAMALDELPQPFLFEPFWRKTNVGETVDVVVHLNCVGSDMSLGFILPSRTPCRILGLAPTGLSPCITLFAVSVGSTGERVDLQLSPASSVRAHGLPSVCDVLKVVEFCAGMGASSIGLQAAGFQQVCAVEWMPALASLHQAIHPRVPVILGNIGDTKVLIDLHKKVPNAFSLMSGVSCQPFSRGGSGGGGNDTRSSTLPSTIRAVHLFQCPVLFIECVVPASENLFVRQHLNALVQQLGYRITETQLKLEETWTACRHRWWVIACHPNFRVEPVPPMPLSRLVVRDLMPFVKEWDDSDQEALRVKGPELQTFQAHCTHLRQFVVNLDKKLPTALHSWGQQAVPCACGCRENGFSDQLLREKGLYAQLLQMPSKDEEPQWRHLHAQEVALLNGVPPLQDWLPNPRLNLCAVGQIASPLQAVWIGSHVLEMLQHQFGMTPQVNPLQCLHDLKSLVIQQSQILFPRPLPVSIKPQDKSVVKVYWNGCDPFVLHVHPMTTVQQLLEAEGNCHQLDTADWTVRDLDNDENVQLNSILAGRNLSIEFNCKPCASPCIVNPPDCLPTLQAEPPCQVPSVPAVQTPQEPAAHAVVEPDTPLPPVNTSNVKSFSQTNPSPWKPSALLNLSGRQLTALIPPAVPEVALCEAMRAQQISSADRIQIVDHQETVWGDDELLWHIKRCIQHCEAGTCWLDPLLALEWAHSSDVSALQEWFKSTNNPSCIITCLLSHGHWTPVIWRLGTVVQVHTWDHDSVDHSWMARFHGMMCKVAGISNFQVAHQLRTFAYGLLCGAAALAFFAHILLGHSLPHKESHLMEFHRTCRQQFRDSLASADQVPRPWCWGAGPLDLTASLASLLSMHGVPSQVSTSRAKLVLQSLGRQEIEKALQSSASWRSLKALANLQKPVIQLVLANEQEDYVKAKKGSEVKTKRKQGGSKIVTPQKPSDLDPAKLILEPGSFRVADDKHVSQITFDQVGPLATGIALVNMTTASTFLKTGQVLTKQGLALLVLNATSEPQTSLQWSSVRFAAKCAFNHEPMLLSGFLIQLGQMPIYLFKDSQGVPIADVAVACARITVYQDQWDGDWETFQTKPVKACMPYLIPIHTCRKAECTCEGWHPGAEATVNDAVLDVFKRQYFSETGRPVVWTKAAYFAFCVRYVKTQELPLLSCSGKRGIYIEPKTEDASAPHLDFQVVWLPHLDFAEISHKAQCEALSLGIARSGARYGVRVQSINFQQVFQSLKPDGLFLAPGPRTTWLCGPWPFGVDRKTLAKVFRQWLWEARPLQPTQTVQGGMMWTAQAVCEPPQAVYNLSHGQVVISKCKPAVASPSVSTEVIGQLNTVQLCSASKTDDPWIHADPWQAYKPSEVPQSGSAPVVSQLAELENRLEQSLLAKLPVANMEVDDQEHRIQSLETQVAHLIGRQQSLEVTVQENHSQSSAQVQQLQAQMTAQMDLQGRKMQSMLDDQMARLESFLAKRGRHE